MGLELYSQIEQYLDFEEEVYRLHKEYLSIVMTKELDDILDIGCGQGDFLYNLAINGKNAFGIDLSKNQIEVCKQKGLTASCMPLNQIEDKYNCATAIFDVVNYIPKDELKQFFSDVYGVLNSGGYFIFDVNTYFGFEEIAQGCLSIDKDDRFISIDALFDDDKLCTDINMFEKQDKLYKKYSDRIVQYYHLESSIKTMLENIGFGQIEVKNFYLHTEEEADKKLFICKK